MRLNISALFASKYSLCMFPHCGVDDVSWNAGTVMTETMMYYKYEEKIFIYGGCRDGFRSRIMLED